MNIGIVEALIYLFVGYTRGAATALGFFLQAIRLIHVDGKGGVRSLLWFGSMFLVVIPVGLTPIFLIFGFVMSAGWDDRLARARLIAFVVGTVLGMASSAIAAHLVFNKASCKVGLL